jgi:hypothetical protein
MEENVLFAIDLYTCTQAKMSTLQHALEKKINKIHIYLQKVLPETTTLSKEEQVSH